MFGAIVLRDIPKDEAQIDLVQFPIQGGFRGFQMAPPGLHYVSVKAGRHHVGFWCWLKPQQVVVKVMENDAEFVDADEEMQAQYTGLALSGAMGSALAMYPHEHFGPWFAVTSHLSAATFPPTLHAEEADDGNSRFDRAFKGTHGGDVEAFLAEFQYAFIRWLMSLDTATQDEVAFERWQHLVLSVYNVGEFRIRESPALFPPLVDALLAQLSLLSNDWFIADCWLVKQAGWFVEDLVDSAIPEAVEKGQAFAAYLEKRAAGG
jgi:hypothetical protein